MTEDHAPPQLDDEALAAALDAESRSPVDAPPIPRIKLAVIRDILRAEGREAFEGMKECLSPRERRVIELMYAPEVGQPLPPADVARLFGVTLERINKFERRAMYRIEASIRANTRALGTWDEADK